MLAVSAVPESLRRHRGIFTKGRTEPGICFGKTIMSLGGGGGGWQAKERGFLLILSTFTFLVFMLF